MVPSTLAGGGRAADAFVLPSRGEGWGRPHVEAMAMGLPVIATNWSGPTAYLDEAVGYALAAFGFSFQIFNGFSLPFPLNLVFLPLTIIEWFLRLQISMEGSKSSLPYEG